MSLLGEAGSIKTFYKNHRSILFFIMITWLKTFVVSTLIFQLHIARIFEVLFFLGSTLGFLIMTYGLGIYLNVKWQNRYYLFLHCLLTIILYANVVYYREFTDIITLPMLSMSANMGDLSTSIFALVKWYDIIYFFDLILIVYLLMKKTNCFNVQKIFFQQTKGYVFTTIIIMTIVISLGNVLEKTHFFNRDQLVRTIGLYSFYVYDMFVHTQTNAQPVFSNEDDWSRIEKHLNEYRVSPNPDMFGIAKDMNVIVVSLESVESFVIGETLYGEEITPFLNELIDDSFYFENFYYQTGQGKTSDAEFLINNSLYPLGRGAVFLTHDTNEYQALPETLSQYGYFNSVLHANDKTFYNRDVMYPNLGYDKYFSFSDYNISIRNSVGWGLKDIDFVEQSMNYITKFHEPFYSTIITLTNHFPFHLDEEDHLIEPFDSESIILNQYFPTVRYTDEAIRVLVEKLKEAGLYENTMLVMYGDHYGIANTHYEQLARFLDKEIDLYEEVKLNRVPLIIHIPGIKGEVLDTISGQIDVMPTLLNLLGIPERDHTMFGNDLFSKDRKGFAVLRNGTVVTEENIFINETCLNYKNGEKIPLELCEPNRERGAWELYFSDKIIYRDLFRFKENRLLVKE